MLKHQGITGKQMAEYVGISPSYVSEIRSGKKNPSLEMFERLLDGAEKIVPGSREYFVSCLAGEALMDDLKVEYLAVHLDDDEFANLVIIRNKYLRGLSQGEKADSWETSLVG